MKKIKMILYTVTIITSIVACKKNNFAVDVDPVVVDQRAEFLLPSFTQAYYIKNGGSDLVIPVGLTAKSANSSTVQFSYTSPTGAAIGTQYSAPSSLNIASGNVIDSLRIKGIFAGYPSGRKDSVKVKLSNSNGVGIFGKDSVWIILQKYCDVTSALVSGTFTQTNEYSNTGAFSYGPYATGVTNFVLTSTTTATCKFVNLYDDGWNDITGTLDWTNPAAFKITIPLQPTGKSYSGAATSVRTSTATGKTSTFSSCDQTMNIFVDLVNNGTTVISSAYEFRLKR